jgi:hypothetical protein
MEKGRLTETFWTDYAADAGGAAAPATLTAAGVPLRPEASSLDQSIVPTAPNGPGS